MTRPLVRITSRKSAFVQDIEPTVGQLALALGELVSRGVPNTATIIMLEQPGRGLFTIAAQWEEPA